MSAAARIKSWFTLPTLGAENPPPHDHTDEDTRMMNSFPKLEMGKALDWRDISDATGMYITGNRCAISAFLPTNHMLVIGEPGSAKTSFLLKLIEQVAKTTDWHIWIVDGKGEIEFAQHVYNVLYDHRGETPIIQVGTGEQGAPLNGLIGDPLAIANAIIKLTGADGYSATASHFAKDIETCAHVVCGIYPGSPVQPPKSFAELEQRLSLDWLTSTYTEENFTRHHLIERLKEKTTAGIPFNVFAGELQSVINELRSVVRPEGRKPVDGCLHLQLCVPNASQPAKRFFAFFVELMKSQMIEMKRRGKRGIIIIDELPAFEDESVKGLYSMARSFGVGVIAATQSPDSLGLEHIKKVLLANSTSIVAFRTPSPGADEIARIAGTIKTSHITTRIEDGMEGEDGTITETETWNIPSGHIAQLPNGHAYIIRAQKWVKVHFDRASVPDNIPPPPTYTTPPDTFQPYTSPKRKTQPPKNPPVKKLN